MTIFETDFAVFRVNKEKSAIQKQYFAAFSNLADADFQNSRNFENTPPFFIPTNKSFNYPFKNLKKLSDWLTENSSSENHTNQCFALASKLIDSLKKVHLQGLPYGCLSSNNILIDDNENIWFSEWSLVSNKNNGNSYFFETSLLNYIAPEQTNRKESVLNFKTDLYALGVVLYEIFAKNNPFYSKNELDTIYKHRTSIPPNPSEFNAKMGLAMAQLILKLLEKNPDKRFSTIDVCNESFLRAKQYFLEDRLNESIDFDEQKNENFRFSKHLLNIYSDKLQEFELLYQQANQQKVGWVCFVEGKNGVQKSEFINNCFNKIDSTDVLSVSVSLKNDQQTPLASFRELLKSITQFYLTRPDDELTNFQNIVSARLGLAVDVLHEIYPKIDQIIPTSKQVSQAKGFDLRNQLIFALAELLKSFVQSQKKILIHFRGFHFTTNNTFGVIEGILKELPLENLLFVFSYEKDSLTNIQDEYIEKLLDDDTNLLKVNRLRLQSLQAQQIEDLLLLSKTNIADTKYIAEVLLAKTNGLPNFLGRIVDDLTQKKKIYFDDETQFWHFIKESLLSAPNFSKNLNDFYEKQFNSLDTESQKILILSALLGDVFPRNILKEAYSNDDFESVFTKLLADSVFKPTENNNDCSFVDADFRNYCLTLLTQNQVISDNELLARAYLSVYPAIANSEYFYSFLNKVIHLHQPQKYKKWIEIGLEVSQKIADFDIAFKCSNKLVALLTDEDWEIDHSKSFNYMTEYMTICSLCLKFDEVRQLHQKLLGKVKTEGQSLFLAWQFAEALLLDHQFEESIQVSIEALNRAKIRISNSPSLLRIIYSSIRMDMLMKGKDLTFFKNLPVITQEIEMYKVRLLQVMIGTAFIINPKMIPELIYKQADFSVKNGFSLNLGICLSCYAFMSANYQKKYIEAERSFELAQDINVILQDTRTFDVNMFLYGAFIHPWFHQFKTSSQQLLENFQHCRQTGYINMAYYNINFIAYHIIFSEEKIKDVQQKIVEVLPYINANTPLHGNDTLLVSLRFLQAIGPKEEDYLTNYFKSATIDEINQRVRFANSIKDSIKKTHLFSCQFFLNFIQETYEIDRKDVIYCKQMYLNQGKGYYQLHINYYFVSLNYVKFERKLDGFEQKYVKNAIKELYFDATIMPDNFEPKALFLDGLMDVKENRLGEGTLKLQKAFEKAIVYEQYMTAGLVARELAKIQEKQGLKNQSLDYFRLAIKYFNLIDAEKVAEKILEKYPQFNTQQKQDLNIVQKIDLQSFINASTSISAEIKLESLLEKMMTVLAENAGAEKVYFIVSNQSNFEIIASKNQKSNALPQHTILNENIISISILQYVKRSMQYVLLENASSNPIYKNDVYVRANNIVSVLCLPVIKNNQLIGIIYFENNLTSNAFTPESTETLNLLASQIAVSFENSQLYDNMEKKVLERTNELLIEKDKSEKLLLNILPSEVAEELKEFGHSEARLYNHVTVFFADFVGFTRLSEKLSPKELIDEVDEYFKAFDMIMEDFGLEKIKTIGDAYLSVCGLPNSVENHALQAAKASKAIIDFINEKRIEKAANNRIYFDIRIGLHSGPVIAGIVGLKKFAYDIWGDTVNTAARMEQASEPNRINLSTTTYELIKSEFDCQYRGKIEAKNKGEIDMYFLE